MILPADGRALFVDAARFVLKKRAGNPQAEITLAQIGQRLADRPLIVGERIAIAKRFGRIEQTRLFELSDAIGETLADDRLAFRGHLGNQFRERLRLHGRDRYKLPATGPASGLATDLLPRAANAVDVRQREIESSLLT